MSRFNFSSLRVEKSARAEFELVDLDCPEGATDSRGRAIRCPRLTLAPATKETTEYWKQFIGRNAGRRLRRGRVSASLLDETREQDRKLYPRYIVHGWEGVFDVDGNPVEFSREACAEFFEELPDYVLDDVRGFAGDPHSFLEDGEFSEEEAADLGNG